MTEKSPIPVINGLSDTHHPQAKSWLDLQTLKQVYGENSKAFPEVAYVGDGNNILHSLDAACALPRNSLKTCVPDRLQPERIH